LKRYNLKLLFILFIITFATNIEAQGNQKINDSFVMKVYQLYSLDEEENLCKLAAILKKAIDLTIQNIKNSKTTRTIQGTFFHPYIISLNESNLLVVNRGEDYVKVYDPVHPDSIKFGDDAGYVYYPKINVRMEAERLNALFHLFININKLE